MHRPANLAEWLAYLETLHPKAIAMGLERVAAVHTRMDAALSCPVITVTGTNGKGSTCAMLEAMLRAAGYRTGLYTSPHLMRYNERVRIAGAELDDDSLLDAFNAVEGARGDVPLTYFEYGTLAALWAFAHGGLDIAVLEVGLGGRLDAVNVVDCDVAIVTSVDLDHMDYLGPTREAIGFEKAGIFRRGKPIVCADPDPPASLVAHAGSLGARLLLVGRDYGFVAGNAQWQYWGASGKRGGLPYPALRGAYQLGNAAAALTALDALRDRLHVGAGAIRDGLLGVQLPGRFEVLPGRPVIVLDVAHNPQAARMLAATLAAMGSFTQTIAVFGMLADKDIGGVIAAIAARIDGWFIAALPGPRGASVSRIEEELARAGVAGDAIRASESIEGALAAARVAAGDADRIVVFGSFLTVAAASAARTRSSDRTSSNRTPGG